MAVGVGDVGGDVGVGTVVVGVVVVAVAVAENNVVVLAVAVAVVAFVDVFPDFVQPHLVTFLQERSLVKLESSVLYL